MNLSYNKKMFAGGIILALICTALAIGLYFTYKVPSYYEKFPLPPFEWDFSSNEIFSEQVLNRSQNLLYIECYAGTVTIKENSISVSDPSDDYFFNHTYARFTALYDMDLKQWGLAFFSNKFVTPYPMAIEQENLTILSSGLAKDILLRYNITEKKHSESEYNYISNGTKHISITLIYEDGTQILFKVFDSVIFVYFSVYKRIYSTFSSLRLDGSIKRLSEQYICFIDELMPNFSNSVVQFLDYYSNKLLNSTQMLNI